MTDELSDRERKLLDAAKDLMELIPEHIPLSHKITSAVAAYDPPVKRYTMPTWDEFCQDMQAKLQAKTVNSPFDSLCLFPHGAPSLGLDQGDHLGKAAYNAIREALAVVEAS